MKKATLLIILFVMAASAQVPDMAWNKLIGGDGSDLLLATMATNDGGFLLGGRSSSNISGDKTENSFGSVDYWVVKTDDTAIIQWQRTLGGASPNGETDFLSTLCPSHEGGFIVGGWSDSPASGNKTEFCRGMSDYWIIGLDADGNTLWQKVYGGNQSDFLVKIIPDITGGYLLIGSSNSSASEEKSEDSRGGFDGWIIKIDNSGEIIWQRTIGGNLGDYFSDAKQTPEGDFIILGYSFSSASGEKSEDTYGLSDYWLLKLDSSGNIVWQKTIGGSLADYGDGVIICSDGSYLIYGWSNSDTSGLKNQMSRGGFDYWLISVDVDGELEWQATIGGSGNDYLPSNSVKEFENDNFILAGSSNSGISGDKTTSSYGSDDIWILKYHPTEGIVWQRSVGGNLQDNSLSTLILQNNSLLVSGTSASSASGDISDTNNGGFDFLIFRLEDNLKNKASQIPIFSVYPNPTTDSAIIKFNTVESGEFSIHDITGKIILNRKYHNTTNIEIVIPEATGIYLLRVTNAHNQSSTFKIVKK